MSLLRSARFPAIVLLAAAILALIIANSPLGPGALALKDAYIGIPGVFEMSVGHWIQDGLLAIFFFMVAVELQFELTSGELNSARKALQPAIAAAGGVIVPIAIFFAMPAGTDVRAWMADPDGDRHRVRARGARRLRQGAAARHPHLPPGSGHPR